MVYALGDCTLQTKRDATYMDNWEFIIMRGIPEFIKAIRHAIWNKLNVNRAAALCFRRSSFLTLGNDKEKRASADSAVLSLHIIQ